MLWEEFRNQAKQDLVSCEFLFNEKGDYGNSAYLLQQSLEKYVKAYILKYELFIKKPHEFRHLPVEKMWELLLYDLNNKKQSYKIEVQDFIGKLDPILRLITEYFRKISDPQHKDFRWKRSVWKQSLNLEINASEQTLFEQLTKEMTIKFAPLLNESNELFTTAKIRLAREKSSTQKKLLINLIDDIMAVPLNIDLEQTKLTSGDLTPTVEGITIWFGKLEFIIKQMIYLTDNKKKQSVLENPFTKVLLLAWLFSFRDEMVMTFPHEELGRYPEIKEINSREIYKNNEKNLEILIKRVSGCCKKIDEMMNL